MEPVGGGPRVPEEPIEARLCPGGRCISFRPASLGHCLLSACLEPARPRSARGALSPPGSSSDIALFLWGGGLGTLAPRGWPSQESLLSPWYHHLRPEWWGWLQGLPGKGAASPLLAPLGEHHPSEGHLDPHLTGAWGALGNGPHPTGGWTKPSSP